MAIDKSLRQYYSRGQLVKPTRNRLRPGYRGPGGYQSGKSDPTSNGGGGGGGGRDARNYKPPPVGQRPTMADIAGPVATPKAPKEAPRDERVPDRIKQIITTPKAPKSTITDRTVTSFKGPMDLKVKTPPEDAREKRISEQYKGIREVGGDAEAATKIALEDEEFTEEELEKGITDDGRIIEYIGDKAVTNKKAKEFSLGLKERNIKTGEIQRGRNIIHPITQQIQSKFAPIDTPKKGVLGTLGTAALGILAPALLPAKLAKAWSTYNQLKGISKLASNVIGKDYVGDLTKNLKSNITTDLLSGKTTPKDVKEDRGRGDGRQVTAEAPKDVVTESIQKFIPSKEQLTEVQKRRATLQGYADKGALNERGRNTLLQMNQYLEKYLVPVAHGGFIDKPLMGRSRDI